MALIRLARRVHAWATHEEVADGKRATGSALSLPLPQRRALDAALLRGDGEGLPDPRAVAFGFYGSLLALGRSTPLILGG